MQMDVVLARSRSIVNSLHFPRPAVPTVGCLNEKVSDDRHQEVAINVRVPAYQLRSAADGMWTFSGSLDDLVEACASAEPGAVLDLGGARVERRVRYQAPNSLYCSLA